MGTGDVNSIFGGNICFPWCVSHTNNQYLQETFLYVNDGADRRRSGNAQLTPPVRLSIRLFLLTVAQASDSLFRPLVRLVSGRWGGRGVFLFVETATSCWQPCQQMLVWVAPSALHSIYTRMFSGENGKLLLNFGSSDAQKPFQFLKTAHFENRLHAICLTNVGYCSYFLYYADMTASHPCCRFFSCTNLPFRHITNGRYWIDIW